MYDANISISACEKVHVNQDVLVLVPVYTYFTCALILCLCCIIHVNQPLGSSHLKPVWLSEPAEHILTFLLLHHSTCSLLAFSVTISPPRKTLKSEEHIRSNVVLLRCSCIWLSVTSAKKVEKIHICPLYKTHVTATCSAETAQGRPPHRI